MFINIAQFISKNITGRPESLLKADIAARKEDLRGKIAGRRILVIGGAGTIGSSFIKAVLPFKPAGLCVVDLSENGLTELTRDLRSQVGMYVPADYKTYPIDFGGHIFQKLFRQEGPFDIVANFAAHKHVRSEKDAYSIEAMVENNVLKNFRLLELLKESPPQHFFCVSTDKATNPVNVMGATKKLMEDVLLAYADELPIATARFANVAFSNGSLLAGFLERLQKRQPFSSPMDVRRYFVSPEESGQLCMLACLLGNSGEIFFPKLREEQMMKFSDIALALLHELGMSPDLCASEEEARQKAKELTPGSKTWPVYFFESDTSGEKLYEEFHAADEPVDWDRFHALGVVMPKNMPARAEIDRRVSALQQLFANKNLVKKEIVEALGEFLPTFNHLETGKSLDQRM